MRKPIVSRSPDVLGGTPVFSGTRVPVQTLLDYLEGGESIDDFLEGFPTVTRDQVVAFTVDQNLAFQQSTARFSIAVVVLRARSNRLADLRPLMPKLLALLSVAKRGEVTPIEG